MKSRLSKREKERLEAESKAAHAAALEAAQNAWRDRYVVPLERMFSGTGVFFTTSVFGMDNELESQALYRQQLMGHHSMAERMTLFVSAEATDLYRKMLRDPFPMFL